MRQTSLAVALALAFAAGGVNAQVRMEKPDSQAISQTIEGWPKAAKHAAMQMMQKYGPPAEATPNRLIWLNNGPWKRTVVQKEEIDHKFPMPHKDVMEQVVDYKVPPEKADELARYDGSVYFDRTRGELSARCDMEAANFVALNLAHDIVTGKKSVEEAREFYPKAVMAHMQKQPSPYAEKLQFPKQSQTADADKTPVSKDMVEKAEEMKQAMMKELEKSGAAGGTGQKK